MLTPILATKLYIPPPRPQVVSRPRLTGRLNEGLYPNQGVGRKLTLISASAGFGKTTLVSEWVAGCGQPVAWLSLDEEDSNLARFLAYLIASLQTIAVKIGAGMLGAVQSPQPPPTELLLTTLLNEIAAIPDHFVLVLDDYHVVDSKPVDEALTFLLEHLPPQMHLVIATREDPQLPLARWRARGQLTEMRAADLRFTPAEAAGFLNQVMGLNLSAEDIAALETRTEGWIAGLQLAALALQGAISMQGQQETASFIKTFTGSHRFVLDYLVEEVLQRQPEHVRSFLLQTAILERLSGPLCDAVRFGTAGSYHRQEGSQGILDALERGNLFIVPLDNQRRWYRYHHLFAEVLRARLLDEQPNQAPVLHRRASEWYEQNGLPADAIRHALAAEDFERAAGLIEQAYPAMDTSFQFAAWLGWVRKLPEEVVRARPVLSVDYAWALTDNGEFEASESRLRDAEQRLDTGGQPESPAGGVVVVDEAQFRTLPARIALARAYHAQAQGDFAGTVKYAELALELSPEEDHFNRGGAVASLSMAYWARGELEAARRAMADWVNSCQKAGNIIFVIASSAYLAEIIVARGQLREAERIYQQSLQLAAAQDPPILHVTAHLYLGLGLLYHEQGDRESAAQHLLTSRELGEQTALVDWPCRWRLAEAQLKESGGDLEAALDLLEEAKRLYVRNPVPDLRPIEALKARVWVRQGRLADALSWVRERDLSAEDDLSYLREFEHITLARVLIARYQNDRVETSIREAMGLLERLRHAAEESGRTGSVIEILVLQALAQEAQGKIPLALASLERALTLAGPEGYIRIFVDEGLPMATLLREAAKRGTAPNYVRQLQAASGKAESRTPVAQPLIEPLTGRELDVLRLFRTELNGPEIAGELVVSLSTLRTHTRNIFNKLGVNNRRAAVRRAEELDLLS